MPFGLKIAIINRAFRKKLDEKAETLGLTSVQLRVLGSISRLEAAARRRFTKTIWNGSSTFPIPP